MKANLFCSDGKTVTLSELTAWEFVRTDGDSADSFFLQAPLQADYGASLPRALRLTAWEGSRIVFCGLVDEVGLQAGPSGLLATVTGRGLAARLMDNQTVGAQFYTVGLEDILSRYVTPYGITAIRRDANVRRLSLFSVPTGTSCWQALCGFCLHAAGIRPRFLADGTLALQASPDQKSHEMTEKSGILQAEWRLCRYGVRSQQQVHDLTYGVVRTAENAAFTAMGGWSCGVATRSGPYLKATERTAQQRLDASARELFTAQVTLPGSFLAEPCDQVTLRLPDWGMTGTYSVYEVRSQRSAAGDRCTLILGQEA